MGELVILCVWTSHPLPVLAAWQTLSALLGLPSLGNAPLAHPQLGNPCQWWHTAVHALHVQLPAGLFFQCLDECNPTEKIFSGLLFA